MSNLYVQFGCGLSAPDGWLNFDASPRLRFENLPLVRKMLGKRALFPAAVRYGDIIGGLPISAGTVKGLYASHVLEHLHRTDLEIALGNAFRVLQPGGVFRLIVPDLAWRVDEYVRTRGGAEAADLLQDRLHFRLREPPHGLNRKLRAVVGLSMHQWMYDEPLMSQLLTKAGFVSVRRCKFGDCEDPAFTAVESKSRFTVDGSDELAMECRKP